MTFQRFIADCSGFPSFGVLQDTAPHCVDWFGHTLARIDFTEKSEELDLFNFGNFWIFTRTDLEIFHFYDRPSVLSWPQDAQIRFVSNQLRKRDNVFPQLGQTTFLVLAPLEHNR